MDKETFFSAVKGVLRIDGDENTPVLENTIVFSCGTTLDDVLVTVSPEVFDKFLSASPSDRSDIVSEVMRLY